MKPYKIALTLCVGTLVVLAPVKVLANGIIDLVVAKNDDIIVGFKIPGEIITYDIISHNVGAPATGVVLRETVPAYTTYDPGNSSPVWSCTPDNSAGSTCSYTFLSTVPSNFAFVTYFAVKIDPIVPCDLDQIANTVTISSDLPDSNMGNNFSIEQTPVDPGSNCGNWPLASTECELTKRYYMYALEDSNQPLQWQPYCYIISSNGYPSTQIQAKLCTPPGFDHTFRATNIPFGGWVSTDCHGVAHYGWPHWNPSWYRPDKAK